MIFDEHVGSLMPIIISILNGMRCKLLLISITHLPLWDILILPSLAMTISLTVLAVVW